jgi:hypothetical protein
LGGGGEKDKDKEERRKSLGQELAFLQELTRKRKEPGSVVSL